MTKLYVHICAEACSYDHRCMCIGNQEHWADRMRPQLATDMPSSCSCSRAESLSAVL